MHQKYVKHHLMTTD